MAKGWRGKNRDHSPSTTIRGVTLKFNTSTKPLYSSEPYSCEVWIDGSNVAHYRAATPDKLDDFILAEYGDKLLGRPYVAV